MTDSPETRASLLLRLRDASDDNAWNDFVELYTTLVFRFAKRKGLQDADAVNISQNVMFKVFKAIREFEYDPRKGGFRKWLFTVCRTQLIDYLRRETRHPQGNGASSFIKVLEDHPDQADEREIWANEHRLCVLEWGFRKVQAEVAESTWLAFEKTTVEGRPVRDVSKELSLSEGAVYTARSRVLAKLKATIASVGQEG
ncbi:MAG: sigma-70 family RNA polymerase sigma factor [Planctomycetales bacterium]|nr:sigma-70 family RNA polymerase sigma factor [Planctomycetales bacterium]